MKDEEAQEKIARWLFNFVGERESLKLNWEQTKGYYLQEATLLMEELGYHKPLDRPDREKIASIHCFRGSLSQWNDLFPIDREPYYKEADQILALIRKDKPPLLSDEEVKATSPTAPWYVGCVQCASRIAQAQWDIWNKWLEEA